MLDPANIHRSNRKTLALYIDPNGKLVIRAPLKMSDARIFDFVKSKQDWIQARQKRTLQNSYINKSVLAYNSFFFLGTELSPVVSKTSKQIIAQTSCLYIPAKFIRAGEDGDRYTLGKVKKWYKERAQEIVEQRVAYFAHRMKLCPRTVVTNNNKTRWGVCDRHGNIALNWRVVLLPPNLLDYIVVHELCHILELNHSKAFWSLVETILPDWKATRKHLKQLNWLMELFR